MEAPDSHEQTPLLLALRAGHDEMGVALVEGGAAFDLRAEGENSLTTPAHLAAAQGLGKTVAAMLKANAAVDVQVRVCAERVRDRH